jgi:hypothetical protein
MYIYLRKEIRGGGKENGDLDAINVLVNILDDSDISEFDSIKNSII